MNGWSNKETWLVNLWFGDNLSVLVDDGFTVDAAFIEQHVDEVIEHSLNAPLSGFVNDMLNSALGRVNYWELGEHYDDDT